MKKLSLKNKLYRNILLFCIFLLISTGCRTGSAINELAEVYYNLGNAYSDLGRSEDARQAYQRAFILKSDFVKAAYNLGRMDIEAGRYDEGLDIFKDILKQDHENSLVKEAIAWGYYKKGDVDIALHWYKSILDKDRYNRNALYNISVLLVNEKNYKDAYPYLKQVESSGDGDAYIYTQLGEAESKLNLSSGIYWFEQARKKDPDSKEILNLLTSAYIADKDYTAALNTYDILLSKGEDLTILFKKAYLLLTAVEDYDAGLKVLEEALKKGFNDNIEIQKLRDYPDLLYSNRINEVLAKYETDIEKP